MALQGVDIRGYIIAGGGSRRMGSDKRLLTLGASTLLERAVAVVTEAAGGEPTLVGDTLAGIAPEGIRTLPDAEPGRGPLGGMVAALEDAGQACALVLAADLPLLTAADLRALIEGMREELDALTLTVDGDPEPLAALYHPRTARLWRRQLEKGQLALRAAFDRMRWEVIVPPGGAEALLNLNRPKDVERLRLAGEGREEENRIPPGDHGRG